MMQRKKIITSSWQDQPIQSTTRLRHTTFISMNLDALHLHVTEGMMPWNQIQMRSNSSINYIQHDRKQNDQVKILFYLTACKLTRNSVACFMKKYRDELKWREQECPP